MGGAAKMPTPESNRDPAQDGPPPILADSSTAIEASVLAVFRRPFEDTATISNPELLEGVCLPPSW